MRYTRCFPLFLVGILGLSVAAQQQNQNGSIIAQQVSLPGQETTADDYIANVLRADGLRGGIEEKADRCPQTTYYQYPPFAGSVGDALRSVILPTGSHYAMAEIEGALLIQSNPEKQSLLDTNIASFSFQPDENPIQIQGKLFALPEVRKRAQELKLQEWEGELGFSTGKEHSAVAKPIKVENMTLRNALMVITATHEHRLLWLYEESTCKGRNGSRFNWLSR